jgi:hypothetical protein
VSQTLFLQQCPTLLINYFNEEAAYNALLKKKKNYHPDLIVQGDSSFTTRTINPIKKLVKITKL